MGDAQFIQPRPNQIQHGGKLRKQQDLMSVFRHTRAQFYAGVQLAGRACVVLNSY